MKRKILSIVLGLLCLPTHANLIHQKTVDRELSIIMTSESELYESIIADIVKAERNRYKVQSVLISGESSKKGGVQRESPQGDLSFESVVPKVKIENLIYTLSSCSGKNSTARNVVCLKYQSDVTLEFDSNNFLSKEELNALRSRLTEASKLLLIRNDKK